MWPFKKNKESVQAKAPVTEAEIKRGLAIVKEYHQSKLSIEKDGSPYAFINAEDDPDRLYHQLERYVDDEEAKPELQLLCEALVLLHNNPAA